MPSTAGVTTTSCMQAIWRKVQSLGLQEEYRAEDSALKKFVQKMAATAFCPPPFMRLAWQGTQQEAPTMDRHNGTTMIMRGHEQTTTLKGGTRDLKNLS